MPWPCAFAGRFRPGADCGSGLTLGELVVVQQYLVALAGGLGQLGLARVAGKDQLGVQAAQRAAGAGADFYRSVEVRGADDAAR